LFTETARIIVDRINSVSVDFQREEDVRVRCESIFIEEMNKMGIPYNPSYEAQVSSGAIDALFNCLCVEYKTAGELSKRFDFHVEEKAKYIKSLADMYHVEENQIAGVILDGKQIGFFRKTAEGVLLKDGPYNIDVSSVERFIRLAHSTQMKALISSNLLKDLGSEGEVTKQMVIALWKSLKERRDKRTTMFMTEWSRLFGQISGFGEGDSAVIAEAKSFGINITNKECTEFIFVLNTVYGIYIKHIALMILQSKRYGKYKIYEDILKTSLEEISKTVENGSMFTDLGIRNFMEGDFFCWYALEWNECIDEAIQALVTVLSQYEPSTGSLKPEVVRDLLKELYQGLLSKGIRHNLGEYYTPDWLAEFTIERSGYKVGNKVLDPSCGSGTFLVLLINQAIEQLKCSLPPDEVINHIQSHIYGFDLNPLAVIAARTNYLIAIEAYINAVSFIEIPVYLSDAIFSPKQEKGIYKYHLDTEDGRMILQLPSTIFEKKLLSEALDKIERLVMLSTNSGGNVITEEEAQTNFRSWLSDKLEASEIEYLIDLFSSIRSLEVKNWDGIWCRIIKNHFSSAVLKDFDVIVGNPPWLKWSALPPSYRDTIKEFCVRYGLFSSDKFYGGVESDVSTMVLYSAAEKWLKQGGTLAMLITRSVFKTESSEGFRMFRLPGDENIKFKVTEVHDYTSIQPFDDAVNKPTLLVLEKGTVATNYPLPWVQWTKRGRERIFSSDSLSEVTEKTIRTSLVAHPINSLGSPWLTTTQEHLEACVSLTQSITDTKNYSARKGVCTDCNGIFYGKVKEQRGRNIVFENNPELGRNKAVRCIEMALETELVYPIAKGKEVSAFKWNHTGTFGIIPQNSMHGYSESIMLEKYPNTLSFFSRQKEVLLKRSSLKRYLPKDPFYSCWNVGSYTFAPYKVCWAEISGNFEVCVISSIDEKIVVPDHKIYFIPLDTEEEALFLCAYLNAPTVEELVLAYVEATQIGTHITDYIKIPTFTPNNPAHMALVKIASEAINGVLTVAEARKRADSLLLEANRK